MANHLYDALFARHETSDHAFLHLPDDTVLTHRSFAQITAALAGMLAALGIRPGDRVAAQVEKSPTSLALYAACLRVGAVFLPLNIAYTDHEVAFFLKDCAASVLFCDPSRADQLRQGLSGSTLKILTMAPDGTGDWQTAGDPQTRITDRTGDDLAAILYTSGTTGRPKGAMLSHDNLLSNARTLVNLWGFSDADTLLHALPVYHSHGLFVACNVSILAGAQMIYLQKFDPDHVINALPRSTVMMGVPTFYTRLLACDGFDREVSQSMRLFISGSAPLLAQTHEAFEALTGHRILERYGLTETSMNTSNPLTGPRKSGTVGLPLPGVDVRIETTDNETTGEIEVKGPNVFKGYWGLKDKTAEAFTEDGYFRTGDLGEIDEDGYITIVGRSKDLIISGGLNIYPKEIETIIDAQPDVYESAVIGLPDPDFGERVIAMIVEAPGHTLDQGALSKVLAQSLAKFKLPKEMITVSGLPRNAMGKVMKKDLRDIASQQKLTSPP
ncbi:AMP-binding protein [Sulfitobacter sp. M22]|uniref:AMP-binding protein n=1 Tax=Sulfitobacter sp. M22 TaxID=2675332 RepID=UPI001F43DEEA|nr:AMP-binding protein [Sulfitobacter sp. M22]MCF7728108.1 AMP-binding protein [Sulfitobacter sp. M22]